MSYIVEITEVPTTIRKQTFKCDQCGDISKTKEGADWHQGIHAPKATRTAGGTDFYYFSNPEDFLAFCRFDNIYLHQSAWLGPGWYGARWEMSANYSDDEDKRIRPLLTFCEEAIGNRNALNADIEAYQRLMDTKYDKEY
jgi:hypothetical protein